jgi:hypothetical protein
VRNGNIKSVKPQLKYYDNKKILEVLPLKEMNNNI